MGLKRSYLILVCFFAAHEHALGAIMELPSHVRICRYLRTHPVRIPDIASPVCGCAHAVNCSTTTRYSPSGGGWHGDPLFPVVTGDTVTVGRQMATPVWLTVAIPPTMAAGTYKGMVTVTVAGGRSHVIAATVTVWRMMLPEPAAIYKSFGEIWSFTLNNFTGHNVSMEPLPQYLDVFTDALLPPDDLYKAAPYGDFSCVL